MEGANKRRLFPIAKVKRNRQIGAENKNSQIASLSPRINPFARIKSAEGLPRLRPVCPQYEKSSQSLRITPLVQSEFFSPVSLKIRSPKVNRIRENTHREVFTPTFMNHK
jgi:hypothetical protein